MERPHPLIPAALPLAAASSALLSMMLVATLRTGVSQEPFEQIQAPERYRDALARGASSLSLILSLEREQARKPRRKVVDPRLLRARRGLASLRVTRLGVEPEQFVLLARP